MTAPISKIQSEGSKLEVLFAGDSDYLEAPGFQDYTESGSEAPTRDIIPAAGPVGASVGRPRVPSIACSFYAMPQHPFFIKAREAFNEGETIRFRLTTKADVTYEGGGGGTAAISGTTGEVTFAGGNEPAEGGGFYGIGSAIVIASTKYIIEKVTGTGASLAIFVDTPAAAVSAAAYSIETPSLRRGPSIARITNFDDWALAVESELQFSFMLKPNVRLPAGVIV